MTTVAASELFGAMAHTAVGTVVAVGRMIYPSLRDSGYDERFSVGLIASSGAIAVVIPPSIAMILYSLSAQQSAVALFTAGILPSLLIGFVDAAYVMAYARFKTVRLTARALGRHLGLDRRPGLALRCTRRAVPRLRSIRFRLLGDRRSRRGSGGSHVRRGRVLHAHAGRRLVAATPVTLVR